jgi:hypothetical protein
MRGCRGYVVKGAEQEEIGRAIYRPGEAIRCRASRSGARTSRHRFRE